MMMAGWQGGVADRVVGRMGRWQGGVADRVVGRMAGWEDGRVRWLTG